MAHSIILQHAKRFALSAWVLALAGCAVGPDFNHPAAPAMPGYTLNPLPSQVGGADAGGTQTLVQDQDIPAQWWTLFHSPQLSELVKTSLKRNPTIDAARAALRQANESTDAQWGGYFPGVSASFNPTRQKTPAVLSSVVSSGAFVYALHTAQLNIAFTPDVWGLNRRQVESLDAQADSQRFQLEAARLTLASNVVVAAIQQASLRAQIAATHRLIESQRKVLESYQQQFKLGQVSQTDVLAQQAQLAQNEATLPPLEKQLAQQRDLMTALAGRLPADEVDTTFDLDSLQLPGELPVSLPSKLVEQRPDIRAADAQLHSASAQIGVAIANRLPNLQISGAYGSAASSFGDLFKPGTGLWELAGDLTQPLFDAGTLKHRQRAAEAAYEQAAAQYRATVITAFQNVADTLHAIVSDADALRTAQYAEQTAKHELDIVTKQHALGDVGSLAVVTAEQSWLQARLSTINARANRLGDSAALMQALGGGWWNDAKTPVPAAAHDNCDNCDKTPPVS
jgi:NodT family efflux transporter outer membrane factor (OMF) lipoprotein